MGDIQRDIVSHFGVKKITFVTFRLQIETMLLIPGKTLILYGTVNDNDPETTYLILFHKNKQSNNIIHLQ